MLGQLDLSVCSSLAMARPPKNTPTYERRRKIRILRANLSRVNEEQGVLSKRELKGIFSWEINYFNHHLKKNLLTLEFRKL